MENDLIRRQEALAALGEEPLVWCDDDGEIAERAQWRMDVAAIKAVTPVDAVPVGRCEDCARNADNGGLYDDGRTRCPIQEHYYLPRNGFCHLWKKRKDGDHHEE